MVANSREALSRSLDALTGFVAGDGTLKETLQRVAELGSDTVQGADLTGITLLDGDRPTTSVFTDPTSPEIDAVQYETGTGPCLDATREQRTHRIDSTTEEQRWVEFCAAAAAKGIHSVMSLPLSVRGQGVGALNFYSRSKGAFSSDDEDVGFLFARQAAIALANSSAYWGATELAEQLNEALTSRAVIDQAKGIIIGTNGCTVDEAFDVLRKASQRENRKLRDIAQRMVEQAQNGNRREGPAVRANP